MLQPLLPPLLPPGVVVRELKRCRRDGPWVHAEALPARPAGGWAGTPGFPADAESAFGLLVTSAENARYEDLDFSSAGGRVALVKYEQGPAAAADGRGGIAMRLSLIHISEPTRPY